MSTWPAAQAPQAGARRRSKTGFPGERALRLPAAQRQGKGVANLRQIFCKMTDEDPRKIHTSTKFYKKSLGNGRTGSHGSQAQALGKSVSISLRFGSFGIRAHKAKFCLLFVVSRNV